MISKENKRVKSHMLLILICIFLFSAKVFPQDDYNDWNNSKGIDINTTGFSLSGSVTNFPLLVRLTSTNFTFSQARGSGEDIRFSNSSDTHLFYEIERWDSAGGLADIWVLVDNILANNNSQSIKMYWGNGTCSDSSNSEAVFNTTNNFAGVWHLAQSDFSDATSNNNNGTNSGTSEATGMIANGKNFDASDYINAGSDATLDNLDPMTIEAWIRADTWGGNSYGRIADKANADLDGLSFFVANNNATYGLETCGFMRDRSIDTSVARAASYSLTLSTWYHLVIVVTTSMSRIYIDGSQPSYLQQDVGTSSLLSDALYNFYIGNSSSATLPRPFDGILDEIRVSSTNRSSDYVRLCYETQNDTQSVVIVHVAPTVNTDPQSDTVAVGDPASFAVNAIGFPAPTYQWQIDTSGTWEDIATATNATYSISSAALTHSGDYRAVAANAAGTDTSSVANLLVYEPIVITLQPVNQTVIEGGTATFIVAATGSPPLAYQWQRDDVTGWHDISPGGDADTLSFVTVLPDDGVHFRCSVSNAFTNVISDSATLTVSDYYNPFKVKAEYYNPTQVRIKIWSEDDISGFPTTTHPFDPWADSVWVMYKTLGYCTTVTDAAVAMYSTEAVKQAAPDSLEAILTVGQLPVPNDSCLWFNFSVLWHIPSSPDSLLQPFIQANKVMMVDTGAPANVLVLHGEYIARTDTALIIIDNISGLNPAVDSMAVVQVSEQPDFSSLRLDDTLSVTDLIAAGASDTIIMDNVAPLPMPKDTLYVQWFIIAKNQSMSITLDTSFTIGWDRPVYAGTLTADTIAGINDRIILSWDAPQATTDSVRYWWYTSPIPLVAGPDKPPHNIPIDQAEYVTPATKTADTITDLTYNTFYYFGLQINDEELWSVITDLSSDTMKTPVGDTTIPVNTIKIDSSKFNTTTNSIELYWHANLHLQNPVNGYRFAYNYHPGLPLTSTTPTQWDTIGQEFNKTEIELGSGIVFDTVYAAGLWLRGVKPDGVATIPAAPTDTSTDTISIPSFTWQIINIFPVDTVYAANQKIICVKHNDPMDITDTVWAYQYPGTLPEGFVDVGSVPFKFDPWEQQQAPFKLGLKYGTLPFRVSESDLALYQVKNNEFHVFYDSEVSNGTVWAIVDKDDMPYPLIALADTIKPAISVRAHNDTITKGSRHPTWFSTVDDVANLHWEFIYGPGNEGYSYGKEAYLSKSNDTASRNVYIEDTSNVIHEKFGVRALIIADDGVRADTVNVSRRVKSTNCEYFSLTAKNWAPLRTTKDIAQTELAEVFESSTSVRKVWEYDIYKYRLYRWYDIDPQKVNSWLEYSNTVKDEFDFVPSRLIWCKTAEDLSIDFGEGVTTSLKEPYEIALKPDNWTDITMPFEFEVMLRDALEASGTIHDSIEVYQWIKDGNKYGYRDLFIFAFDSLTNEKDTLTADQKNGGCTVFNHYSSEVKLLIPPISLPLSKYVSTATRQPEKNSSAWDISLRWKNSLAGEQQFIKRVRCGYKQGDAETIFGMLPPSMSSVLVGVLDSSSNRICGWALKRSLDNNGGVSFDICFRNYSDNSAKIEYYLDNLGILPDGFNAKLFNSKTMEYEECTADNIASIDLSTDAGASRILAIGSGNYFNYLISAFLPMKILKAYPNPFNSMVKIHYRIPAGIKEVRFNLYNLQGKLLWNGRDHKNVMAGEHIFYFDSNRTGNGKLPNGVYILRLSAKNSSGKTVYGGEKRITCIK